MLFYGCWGDTEQIYEDEMENYKKSGVLQEYYVAKSRQAGVQKVTISVKHNKTYHAWCEFLKSNKQTNFYETT
jgi:sulfite reductase alpha subunit-like flavoprotein